MSPQFTKGMQNHVHYTAPSWSEGCITGEIENSTTIEKDWKPRDQSVGVATIGASLQNFNMEEIGELLFKKILPCHGSPD